MSNLKSLIKRHPVITYYLLVFAISWGLILVVLGPSGFMGTSQKSNTQLYVSGPLSLLGPSISSLLMTGLLYGKKGFRDLLSRLIKWRVGLRWYAFALFTAPIITCASLLLISLVPIIFTAADKWNLITFGFAIGVSVPFFEEMGWTGFAILEIRKRNGIFVTGIIMGLLWGLWHFPIFSASAASSGEINPVIYMIVLLFAWLIPYRVLIVWVYDHTKSLLLAMLMHVPIVVGQFVLLPQTLSGAALVKYILIFAAVLWLLVLCVMLKPSQIFKKTSTEFINEPK